MLIGSKATPEFRAEVHKRLDAMFDALDNDDFTGALGIISALQGLGVFGVPHENHTAPHTCACGGKCKSEEKTDSDRVRPEMSEPTCAAAKECETECGWILGAAYRVINGERQDSYGNPEDCFATIAEFWDTYLQARLQQRGPEEIFIQPVDVAFMMVLLKIAREARGAAGKMDNFVDAAGYLGIAADIVGRTPKEC